MKKKLLCLFSLFTFLGYAQMPVEGFEGSWPPEGWSVYQNDIGTAIMWEQSIPMDPFISPYEGNFSAVMRRNMNAGGITQDWLVSPVFVPAVGSSIDFFSSQIFAGNQGSTFKLLIIPADDDPSILANYDILEQWTETTAGIEPMTYTQKVVGIPEAFIGTSVRVAFLAEGGQDTWVIDNVNLESNACAAPTELGVNDITVSQATLHWQGTADAWEIEVLPANDAPTGVGVEIEENSYIATSLAPGIYKYYVRAKCNEDEYSYWWGPVPFAIYNGIRGMVRYDSDNDGDCDSDDIGVPGVTVNITLGENIYTVYTNAFGQYALNNITLTDNVTVEVVPPAGFPEMDPISVPVDPEGNPTLAIDVCLEDPEPVKDMEITIVPLNQARPGFQANYDVVIKNMGTIIIPEANVVLDFNDAKLDFVSGGTLSDTGNAVEFTLTNLQPFSIHHFNVAFLVAAPPENIGGEVLDFLGGVFPMQGDIDFDDNMTELHQTIVNSYDPNDITCHEGVSIFDDEIEDYLYYTIRFQNTGTAEAINIRLENQLANNLDWDTFQPFSSSHDYTVQREGNEVQFYYTGINLPDEDTDEPGSQGYVTYRIKPKADVSLGDIMYNDAGIYFDFNPVIETNTAETEVIERPFNGVANNTEQNLAVYPNPVKDVLTIQTANETVSLIEVYDINGRLCFSHTGAATVNVQSLKPGIYFVKITAGSSVTTKKIVKQ